MRKTILLLCIAATPLFFYSCKKDADGPGGLESRISKIVSKDFRSQLASMGMDIYEGDKAPNVEGTISMTPNLLLQSNVPGDPPSNTQFVHYSIKFYEQEESNNSIKFSSTGYGGASPEKEESNGAVISGSGNNFTVYGRSTVTVGSNSVVVAVIYSGTLDGSNNIKKLKRAIVVVDDSNRGNILLTNGHMRVFHDGDSKSAITR
ncbi:MAG TPA: hypothetical protein PKC69_07060 [Chitinophagaceae bacterium]|nr:hypothetical protein [Chitinophagaceae bacterium]